MCKIQIYHGYIHRAFTVEFSNGLKRTMVNKLLWNFALQVSSVRKTANIFSTLRIFILFLTFFKFFLLILDFFNFFT